MRVVGERRNICTYCSGSAAINGGFPCDICGALGWLDENRQPLTIIRRDGTAVLSTALVRALLTPSQPKPVVIQPALPPPQPDDVHMVAPSRIAELRACAYASLDFCKLIRFCEELNTCYEQKCYVAVSTVTRALLDHVPPIFGYQKFKAVVANYSGGRSFSDAMRHLDEASRKISDGLLHMPMRQSEVLPTSQQVNCSQQIDALLAEIVRITPKKAIASS